MLTLPKSAHGWLKSGAQFQRCHWSGRGFGTAIGQTGNLKIHQYRSEQYKSLQTPSPHALDLRHRGIPRN
jgi:hypothetical protein